MERDKDERIEELLNANNILLDRARAAEAGETLAVEKLDETLNLLAMLRREIRHLTRLLKANNE